MKVELKFYELKKEPIKVIDYPEMKMLKIEGIKYSYELFKAFSESGINLNVPLKITERKEGFITVKLLKKE